MKKHLLILISMLCAARLCGQDIHFSQFYMSPLTLNPALTGEMDGSYRAVILGRLQWASVKVPFITTSISGDTKLFKRALGGSNYVGLGGYLTGAMTGDGNVSNVTAALSVAYHKSLDYDGNFHLSAGVQGLYKHDYYNTFQLRFYDQIFIDGLPLLWNTSNNNGALNISYFDMGAGLAFSGYFSRHLSLNVGLSGFNLLQPAQSPTNAVYPQLGQCYTAHITAKVSSCIHRLFLYPMIVYTVQGPNQELTYGGNIGLNLTRSRYRLGNEIYVGEQYRNGSTSITTIGVKLINGWQAGLSYDVNVSTLKAADIHNTAFELGIQYIGFRRQDAPKPSHHDRF